MTKSKQPTIAITGASGFLGTDLLNFFVNKGWNVVALVRDQNKLKTNKNIEYRAYDITKPVSNSTLKDVDYLVHAAYVKLDKQHPDAMEINISGAKNLLKAAKTAALSKIVFISTMSAHEDAISVYGRQKLEIERLFLESKNATVLRCGLIVGNGGIVREMAGFMKSKHAVPLVGGGNQPLQIISVYDLVEIISNVLERSLTGRFVAANPKVYSYRSFYQALAAELRVNVLFVPLPYGVLEGIFKFAELFHIPLGVGDDNLKGLKMLKSMPSKKDMKLIGVNPINLEKALAKSSIRVSK